ncbi:hypothetical protein ACMA5I_10280 [Paracoccaceae bacterium GXU_MW_L88]
MAVLSSQTTSYEAQNEPVTVEIEKEVDSTEKRIKDAQNTALSEIEAEADKQRQAYIELELQKIEAQVLADVEAELKERRLNLEDN